VKLSEHPDIVRLRFGNCHFYVDSASGSDPPIKRVYGSPRAEDPSLSYKETSLYVATAQFKDGREGDVVHISSKSDTDGYLPVKITIGQSGWQAAPIKKKLPIFRQLNCCAEEPAVL
jgi:hypothetical protein